MLFVSGISSTARVMDVQTWFGRQKLVCESLLH